MSKESQQEYNKVMKEVEDMLVRLSAQAHQNRKDNSIETDWADVGTANHIKSKLREISDFAFNEGEHKL